MRITFIKKAGFLSIGFFLILSCSKDKTNNSIDSLCGTIDWKNSNGDEGFFEGKITNNNYLLTQAEYRLSGESSHLMYYLRDANNHVINNNPVNFTYTYDSDNMVNMTIVKSLDISGTATFNFDSLSQLKTIDISGTNGTSSLVQHNSYIYDNNGDPVYIVINEQTTDDKGTSSATYDIVGTYLSDKEAVLTPVPELAPYSLFFAFNYYLSKHLINTWQIHGTGVDYDGSPLLEINVTDKYSYTYNADGTVASMIRSFNTQNIYTFTYSDCQ